MNAQEVYKGWLPYYTGRDGDTSIGVYIKNSGTGYAGFYAIRDTDTLRFHWDKNGEVVLNYLDSLYLQSFNLYYLNYSTDLDSLFINGDTLKFGGKNYWRWGEGGAAADTLAPIADAEVLFFDGVQVLTDWQTLSQYNTFLGMDAVGAENLTDDADNNTGYGFYSLHDLTKGDYNTAIGARALENDTTGQANTALGYAALYKNLSADNNTAIGYEALYSATTGGNNTALGYNAGRTNDTGTGNVFIGYNAGYSETGSDKLYIENTNGADPLIWGDFLNDTIRINGALEVEDMPTGSKAYFVVVDDEGETFYKMDTTPWSGGGGDTCLWYYVADDTIKTYHNVWMDSSLNMKYTTNLDTYYFLNGDAAFGNAWPNMAWGFNDPYNSDSSGAVMINHSDGYRINLTTRDLTYESTIAISNDGISMWAYIPGCSTEIDMTVEGINIQSDTVIVLDADSIFMQAIPEEEKDFILMIDGNTGKLTKTDTSGWGGGSINRGWNHTGNYVILQDINDSVGIGDATPDYKLDVEGNTNIVGTLRVSDINLTSASTGTSLSVLVLDGGQNVDVNNLADDFAAIEDSSKWYLDSDTAKSYHIVKVDSGLWVGRFHLFAKGTAPDDTLCVIRGSDTIRLIPPR